MDCEGTIRIVLQFPMHHDFTDPSVHQVDPVFQTMVTLLVIISVHCNVKGLQVHL